MLKGFLLVTVCVQDTDALTVKDLDGLKIWLTSNVKIRLGSIDLAFWPACLFFFSTSMLL
ncbi:hypothetical protein CLV51_102140 [Chitinophaga niastensis]|uniref:Uncharacterized protein n=1 Tax=Chitinophaga niastensis TaxID=536980 RepID=A0A2P8HM45_CHINA|nr:hypothetical protein CLV51_102140 [Chitinophaga niastensis]